MLVFAVLAVRVHIVRVCAAVCSPCELDCPEYISEHESVPHPTLIFLRRYISLRVLVPPTIWSSITWWPFCSPAKTLQQTCFPSSYLIWSEIPTSMPRGKRRSMAYLRAAPWQSTTSLRYPTSRPVCSRLYDSSLIWSKDLFIIARLQPEVNILSLHRDLFVHAGQRRKNRSDELIDTLEYPYSYEYPFYDFTYLSTA